MIVTRSDAQKEHFAKEIIPTLGDEYFEVFRPLLQFVAAFRVAATSSQWPKWGALPPDRSAGREWLVPAGAAIHARGLERLKLGRESPVRENDTRVCSR